jgi:folate-binding protein YgfZ
MQTPAKTAILVSRGVLRVGGADARAWLQGLVTNDVEKLAGGQARFAALLSPQGKILFDFFVTPDGDGLLIDCAGDQAGALARRLAMYRLRAPIEIADLSGSLSVAAVWDGDPPAASQARVFPDPRDERLGWRAIGTPDALERLAAPEGPNASESEYHAHRLACGAPEGGADFGWGEAFPHEANMDRLNGVDFRKGCYVGQEVVSRVQHRGLARKRFVAFRVEGTAPARGAEVLAGQLAVGTMGSSTGGLALALVRLDRLEEAQAAATPLRAGEATLIPA